MPRALRLRAGRAGRRARGAGDGCRAPSRSRSRTPSPRAAGWAARRRPGAPPTRTSPRRVRRAPAPAGPRRRGCPETLDAYAAHGGLAGLRDARRLGPAGILAALKASRLAGRGGAAFPAATKWEAVAQHPARPHYVVVNADESETGTFKDRILLEWDPYAVLEGAAIAAYTCGAERVFIYIRGEYRHAHERLARAIRGGGAAQRLRRGCSAATPASRSSSGAAPAPTSAARRRRSSTRSRESAASRARSLPSPSTTVSSAGRP